MRSSLLARREAAPARGVRVGLLMLLVFLAAEVTWLLASVFLLVPFAANDPSLAEQQRLPIGPLVTLLVVPTLLAALIALAGTALLGGGSREHRVRRELAIHWNLRDMGTGLLIGLGGLLITVPAAALWAAWAGSDANSAVGEAFAGRQLAPGIAVAVFLGVWLLAPLGEEIVYRGVLWRALEHWRWNRWLVFAVTTVVFSVAHLELLRTPLLLVISIPVGLARMFTGNVLASVVAHQTNNFLPAISLLLATTA
ncbi:CPBP family intramembrane glutamic endopeptidase [Qaidamihabitans albus]|uniref:CPBP family intramembrane glutamic endopeptidase n=1 Tax=Qaidamihabitans albus TaxID=2795733 RepID=UPI0027DBF646|nr:CPBP family intramembrane glutamic endopeptidase [Qaidamihabitans albus]